MKDLDSAHKLILDTLKHRACLKQEVFGQVKSQFKALKLILKQRAKALREDMSSVDERVEISYSDIGEFEAQLKFGGDILIFTMHSNVFTFSTEDSIQESQYVIENPDRAYCGIINIYNFLADSFKYNRLSDPGYLIGRIFINKENHFMVEGKRQLGFLYNDFSNAVLNEVYLRAIAESSMLYALDFDLLVPQFDDIKEMSVHQKIQQTGIDAVKTGKRLGFQFSSQNQNP